MGIPLRVKRLGGHGEDEKQYITDNRENGKNV
jgi:hypothetical protein